MDVLVPLLLGFCIGCLFMMAAFIRNGSKQ